jgi:hypothetical protein
VQTDYLVYEHWRTDTNTCFYVGKGHAGRERRLTQRGVWHRRVVDKLRRHGHDVEIRVVEKNLHPESASAFEKMRIAYWRACGVELVNATEGGDGTPGNVLSEETKAKIAAKARGRKLTDEHKDKVRQAFIGRYVSPETRAKMSANSAMKRPDIVAKNADARRGQKRTEEQRNRMSEAQRGKHIGEANHFFGKKHSEETRAKMRKPKPALAAYFARKRAEKELGGTAASVAR